MAKNKQLARIKEVAKKRSKEERLATYREMRDRWIALAEDRVDVLGALELMRAAKMLTEIIDSVAKQDDDSDNSPKSLIIPGWTDRKND